MTSTTMPPSAAEFHERIARLVADLAGGTIAPDTAETLSTYALRDYYMREVLTAWEGSRDDSALLAQADACATVRTVAAMTCAAGFTWAAGDAFKAQGMLKAVLNADGDYSLALLLDRALRRGVPGSVWLEAVRMTSAQGIVDSGAWGVGGMSAVTWDGAPAQPELNLNGPAALVSHLRVILDGDLARPYLGIALDGSGAVQAIARADESGWLAQAMTDLGDVVNADRAVLVSLNGDADGLRAVGGLTYLPTVDLLAVDVERMTYRSALCDDATCCPADGVAFEWASA